MRFIATLHTNSAAAARADKAHAAFKKRYGSTNETRHYGRSRLSVAGAETIGSGYIQSDDRCTVVPYRLVLTNGTAGRLNSFAGRDSIERFLDGDWELPVAPFAAIRIAEDRITSATDFCGHAKVFSHGGQNFQVVTNCIHSAQAGLGRELDEYAVLAYAAGGYLPDDRTFHAGLRILRPAERLSVVATETGIKRSSHLPDFQSLSAIGDRAEEDVLEVLKGVAKSLIGASDGPLTLGLSGGRDSRLMAAVFLAVDADLDLYTMDKFAEETSVVEDLIARIGRTDRFRITLPPTNQQGELFDPQESARTLVTHHAGLQESGMIGRADPVTLPEPFMLDSAVQISGAAGELLHGQLYPKLRGTRDADFSQLGIDRETAIKSIPRRIIQKGGISPAATRVFTQCLTQKLREAPLLQDGIRILDWYYLFHKQRRWSSSAANNRVIAPMVSAGFALGSLRLPTEEIARSVVPKRLTERLVPGWRDVPYVTGQAGLTARRPRITREHASTILDRTAAKDILRYGFDMDGMNTMAGVGWDDTRPDLRDAIFKRALWLCEVADQFG